MAGTASSKMPSSRRCRRTKGSGAAAAGAGAAGWSPSGFLRRAPAWLLPGAMGQRG